MTGNLHRAAVAALLLFAVALIGFGGLLDGYSHVRHAPALLGATGDGRALAFNLLAFVLPGALVAATILLLRSRHDAAGWAIRLGLALWLLSALAFAAQGVFPIDASSAAAPANARHAASWSLWWMAFVPGSLLLAIGAGKASLPGPTPWPLACAAILVPVAALLLPALVPVGVAQRVAFGLWFACVAWTTAKLSRFPQP